MKYVNENGRSMVEMLGVLAIIGVLSVGGIAGYSKAMNKYKINKTNDQVSMLVANIRTLFASQGNYADLNNGNAIKFGVVPNDMYTSAANGTYASDYALSNAFKGAVTIKSVPARQSTGTNASTGKDEYNEDEAFIVAYDGMTEEACVAMLTGDWGSGQASGLISIAGGKGNVETAHAAANLVFTDDQNTALEQGSTLLVAAPGRTQGVPVAVGTAVGVCNGGNSGNAVAWKYY